MKASTKNVLKEFARSGNWTDNEFEEFAKLLADDKNAFAVSLEKLALKKSANNEVFSQRKIVFDWALRYPDFKKKKKRSEELHFKQKDGKILEQNLWQSQEWKSLVTNQGTELVSYFKRNICGKKRGT